MAEDDLSDEEVEARLAIWARLYLESGKEPIEGQLVALVETTAGIPWKVEKPDGQPGPPINLFVRAACAAGLHMRGGFPPGPGDILNAAIEIAGKGSTDGHGTYERAWVKRARLGAFQGKVLGLAFEDVKRIGSIASDVKLPERAGDVAL